MGSKINFPTLMGSDRVRAMFFFGGCYWSVGKFILLTHIVKIEAVS